MLDSGLERAPSDGDLHKVMRMHQDDVLIESISDDSESSVRELIRRNLQGYDEAGSVLAASFRRLNDLLKNYSVEGSRFFVLRDMKNGGAYIGGAGIGSLHGLPPSEGL